MNNSTKKRKNRSDAYQVFFLESAFSSEMMEVFCNTDSISHRLNPFEYDEELIDLEDQLKVEFWRVVDSLTDRQKEVLKLYSDGYTQMEIAKKLHVNQSSITKSLRGNVDYSKNKRSYGGSEKKIKKIIESDEKIREILRKMQECRIEKW